MVTFDTIWQRIKDRESERFIQIQGRDFTYVVAGNSIAPDRTNQNIPRAHFEKASRLLPLENTVPLQDLRGPSYIYAVLMDDRIRESDW